MSIKVRYLWLIPISAIVVFILYLGFAGVEVKSAMVEKEISPNQFKK
jgi:hypothetical protein